MHRVTAKRGDRGKETLIEQSSQPLSTSCRMDTEKMDIGLVGIGLRNEPDEECDDLTINNSGEAGGPEVDEEESGQHGRHRPTTPPCINDRNDRLIIAWFYLADDNPFHRFPLSSKGWLACTLLHLWNQVKHVISLSDWDAQIAQYCIGRYQMKVEVG